MRMATMAEAQRNLPELVREAREETVGLTDESGNLLGLLAGVDEDGVDDLLVQTPAFQNMIARSRASLEAGKPVSASQLLAEAKAELTAKKQ